MKYSVERMIVLGGGHGMKFHTLYNSLLAVLKDFRQGTIITKIERL